jgi:hypothetical protein
VEGIRRNLILKYYSGIFLEALRKTIEISVGIVYVLIEIRIGHIPNTSQKHYRLSQLAQYLVKNWAQKLYRYRKRISVYLNIRFIGRTDGFCCSISLPIYILSNVSR